MGSLYSVTLSTLHGFWCWLLVAIVPEFCVAKFLVFYTINEFVIWRLLFSSYYSTRIFSERWKPVGRSAGRQGALTDGTKLLALGRELNSGPRAERSGALTP